MAHIKCNYRKKLCTHPYSEYFRKDVMADCYEEWAADNCPYYQAVGKSTIQYDGDAEVFRGKEFVTIDDRCRNISVTTCEFEKNVKNYELEMDDKNHPYGIWKEDTGFLRIGRTYIDAAMIDYLEIDGRVLIGGDQNA